MSSKLKGILAKFKGKSGINLVTGLGYQCINMVLGLILPHLFITTFGSETNGLLNSISQFFLYLGLLEAGIATTSVQALYGLVSKDDRDGISSVLSATHRYYIRSGIIYAVLLIGLSFLYPVLVDTELPFSTVVAVIILQGASSVWSYFFQSKYEILLKADGKIYVINIVLLITSILKNAGKIIAIYLGYDVVMVQAVNFVVTIIQSAIFGYYIRKRYSWVNFKATPNNKAIEQHNSVLIQHVAFLVFNHTDILTLTFILQDLKLVSVYSVYSLVFDAIQNLVDAFSNSFHYKMGQLADDKKQLRAYFEKYEKLYYGFGTILNVTAYLLLKSFLTVYVGDVTDINYIIKYLPELFLVMKMLSLHRNLQRELINAVGHFRKTQTIGIIEMSLNLCTSIFLVFLLGINGVVIGTIIALLFSSIAYSIYCNKYILESKTFRGYLFTILNAVIAFAVCAFGRNIIPMARGYISFFASAVPVFGSVSIIFICYVLTWLKTHRIGG